MKSLIISFFAAFFILLSCKKEEIKPFRNFDNDSFEGSSRSALTFPSSSSKVDFVKDLIFNETNNGSDCNTQETTNTGTVSTGDLNTGGTDTDSGGVITDPNNEPDASKRKGKK